MKIAVTQEDIERGRRCDPDNCPVARALARAGVSHRGVVGPTVMLSLAQGPTAVRLPMQVKNWVLDFDAQRPVAPFSFDFDHPANERAEPSRSPATAEQSGMLVEASGPAPPQFTSGDSD